MAAQSIASGQGPGAHPEFELLLCCSRTAMDCDGAERMQMLAAAPLDWDFLVESAARHGIAPLVYRHLLAVCPDTLPVDAWTKLRTECHATTINNLFLTDELLSLLDRLAGAGIRAIPFKGPVLAAAVYGDLASRAFKDLDILVSPADVQRAREVLVTAGYRLRRPFSTVEERTVLRRKVEFSMEREDGRVLVDLRWRLTPKYAASTFEFDALWARRGTVCLEGREVPNLSPEDLLLVLSIHGTKHQWERLDWICGLAQLIGAHPDLDWAAVDREAASLRVERVLWLSLLLCRDLLGVSVPEDLLRRARGSAAARALARSVSERLMCQTEASSLQGDLFCLQTIKSLPERIRFCRQILRVRLAPSDADLDCLKLPRALRFLYFVIRPLRLLGEQAAPRSLQRSVDDEHGDRNG